LAASILLGLVWGLWHIPLYFVSGTGQFEMLRAGTSPAFAIGGFVGWTIGLSVLFTWLFNQTGGSLIVVILFHAAVNLAAFLPSALGSVGAASLLNVLVTWIVAILVGRSFRAGAPGLFAPATCGDRAVSAGIMSSPTAEQLSFPKLVALHLVPGALVTIAFVAFAPVIKAAGFPPIAALLAAILLLLVPIELGTVLRAARRDGFDATVPYRQRLRGRNWLWLVPALVVAALAGFGAHMLIEPWLIDRFFGWLPEWFVLPLPLDHVSDYSTGRGGSRSGRSSCSTGSSAQSSKSSISAAICCRAWSASGGGRLWSM
jgi:hypothetical protein